MGQPNTVCADWRFAQATDARNWIENAHTNLSSPSSWLDTTLCIRWLLDNTGDKNETAGYDLQYRVDGASWVTVTTSTSYVKAVDHPYRTDGQSTSQELGSGTFDEGYWDDTGSVASYTLTSGQESENEHSFQFIGADVSGHTIELRASFAGGGNLDGYTYSNPSTVFPSGEIDQVNFRVRYEGQGLNVDSGWLGALNESVDVYSDDRVYIRFELENSDGLGRTISGLRLQYNRAAAGWTNITYEPWKSEVANPTCFSTLSDDWNDGDATANLLSGSSETFTAGTAEENCTAIAGVSLTSQHTEIECCVLMRKFYDGPSHNADGTTFAFRIVESDGTPLDNYDNTPTLTLRHADGHIGACPVESPGKVGPFADGNGNLYYVVENTETDALMMVIKSDDGGRTWLEVDGSNRPSTGDLESVGARLLGDLLHIVHHPGGEVVYNQFRVSTHSTNPDTWAVTDQSVDASAPETDQAACMEARSDGTVVAAYRKTVGGYERIYYNIRSSGGTWGTPAELDSTASVHFTSVVCIKGASDRIHFFYKDDSNGDIYHKSLSSGDSLGARDLVENDAYSGGSGQQWAMTTAVYWDDGGDEKIMIVVCDDSDELLYSVVVTNDGTPETRKQASDYTVVNDPSDLTSRQPAADIAIDPETDTIHLLYGRLTNGDMYKDGNVNDGSWGTDIEQHDAVTVHQVRASYIRHSGANGGADVIGYVWSDNGGNGTGFLEYNELVLRDGFPPAPDRLREVARNTLLRL